jgi:hypothetical protein
VFRIEGMCVVVVVIIVNYLMMLTVVKDTEVDLLSVRRPICRILRKMRRQRFFLDNELQQHHNISLLLILLPQVAILFYQSSTE